MESSLNQEGLEFSETMFKKQVYLLRFGDIISLSIGLSRVMQSLNGLIFSKRTILNFLTTLETFITEPYHLLLQNLTIKSLPTQKLLLLKLSILRR